MHKPFEITREELKRLYTEEMLNAPEIGRRLGFTKTTILRHMKAFGIPRRKQSESLSSTVKKLWATPEYRAKMLPILKSYWNRSEERSQNTKKLWQNPIWRASRSQEKKQMWANQDYRRKTLVAQALGQRTRPTIPEQNIIDVISSEKFPFKYCGDGSFIVGRLNPDFISVDGSKKIIELFGRMFHDPAVSFKKTIPWHQQYWGRMAYYSQFGYECLIVWDDDSSDNLMEKLRRFAS